MPEKFDLSKISNRHSSKEIKKRHLYRQKPILSSATKAIAFFKRYTTQVLLSYYLIIILTAISTAVIIEKTKIAKYIMDEVRRQQRAQLTPAITDLSSINITTDHNLVALLIFPNGDRAGETIESIRFIEAKDVYMPVTQVTDTSLANWALHATQPPSGIYLLDFGAKTNGDFRFNLEIYDASGRNRLVFQETITLTEKEYSRYQLVYNKLNSQQTKLTFLGKGE
jgi:hypothetical protein